MDSEFVEVLERYRGRPGNAWDVDHSTRPVGTYDVIHFIGILILASALYGCERGWAAWVIVIPPAALSLYYARKTKKLIHDAWHAEFVKREMECLFLWMTFEELCEDANLDPEEQLIHFWTSFEEPIRNSPHRFNIDGRWSYPDL